MKVAYLGPKATFTEVAAKKMFIDGELISLQPIRRVIQAVEREDVEYGVVPLENFYQGEVIETLDALTECSKTRIISEAGFPVVHCLGVLKGSRNITQILSKDQALSQCSRYLCESYPNALTIQTASTSEAAQRIAREGLTNAAAIGPEEALIGAGLEIIARDLCPNNRTRFVGLGRGTSKPTGNDRTFLVFHPIEKDRAGTLHTDLGFFSSFGVNLDYIQSRPDGSGGYLFYLELTGHERDEPIKRAIESLRYSLDPENKYPNCVKILGSFENKDWKNGVKK